MKSFLDAVGLAIVIASFAVSCEFCTRPDKSQGPGQWFGCCPETNTSCNQMGSDPTP